MNIYNVNPDFIKILRKKYPNVLTHKDDVSSNGGRKYFGIVLKVNDYNYYVPISKPHDKDYTVDAVGNKVVKDDDLFTVRMTHIHSQTGQKLLDGCFRIGNMIPIPNSELSSFTIKSEPNSYLKKSLGEIYKFAKINEQKLKDAAKMLINISRKAKGELKQKILPFKKIQKDVAEFTRVRIIQLQKNNHNLVDETFHSIDYGNNEVKIIHQSSSDSKYFVSVKDKQFRHNNFKSCDLMKIDNNKIKKIKQLEEDIKIDGIGNLSIIVENEIAKIKLQEQQRQKEILEKQKNNVQSPMKKKKTPMTM